MALRRTSHPDLDSDLARLEREVAAATGSPVAPRQSGKAPERRAEGGRLSRLQDNSRSLFRKLAAVAILIVAAAILLKVAVGFLASIVWLVVAVVAVVGLLWAWRQL